MREEMTALERQLATEIHHLMGPVFPVDDRAVFEAVAAANRPWPWGSTMFAALRFLSAGAIVALFAGFLLLGVLTTEPRDDLAPALPPSPLVARFTDPVGDVQRSIGVPVGTPRPAGPDIVAVSTSATDDEVVIEVQLVEDWALAESTLWAFLYPNPIATYQRDEPLPPSHFCGLGYDAFVQIQATERAAPPEPADHTPGPDPTAEAVEWPSGAWITPMTSFAEFVEELLPYEVDGRRLRITIPLAYLGDPETLSLGQVRVVGLDPTVTEGDYFPNDQDACVPVPLPGGLPNG